MSVPLTTEAAGPTPDLADEQLSRAMPSAARSAALDRWLGRLGRDKAASNGNGTGSIAGPVRLNLLIAGTYAWAVTVATPAWGSGSVAAIVSALGALFALFGGILGSHRWPKAGRALTMAGFLGLSCVTWLLMGPALNVELQEPVRSALGALGWLVFALGWGSVRQPGAVPEDDPRVIRQAEPLQPRRALPRQTFFVFALAVVAGLLPWLLAWRVEQREHALLAHAVGLGLAMWLVSAGVQIAVTLGGTRSWDQPRSRLLGATSALAWVAALVAIGVVYKAVGGR